MVTQGVVRGWQEVWIGQLLKVEHLRRRFFVGDVNVGKDKETQELFLLRDGSACVPGRHQVQALIGGKARSERPGPITVVGVP